MKTLVTIGVIIDPATNPLNAEERYDICEDGL